MKFKGVQDKSIKRSDANDISLDQEHVYKNMVFLILRKIALQNRIFWQCLALTSIRKYDLNISLRKSDILLVISN